MKVHGKENLLKVKEAVVEDEAGPLAPVLDQAPARTGPQNKPVSLWRSWYIASLMAAIAVSFLGFGLVSPLRTLYARAEGATSGEAGIMGAAFLFSSFVFLFPFGWLSDRYSRVSMIVIGLAAHGLITLAYLYATSAELFIALRFVEGITAAAVMPAARALLADLVPPGRNGEAFGLLSANMTFGMFAGPPIGTFLASGFGYHAAYWLAGLLFIPAMALVLLAFRNYRPAAVGHPDAPAARPDLTPRPPSRLWTGPIVVGCLVRMAIFLGPGLAISIWSLYMFDLGYDLNLIGWTYVVYAVPTLFLAPRAGRLSDRYGRMGMMFGGGLLIALCWISYGFLTAFVVMMVMGVVEGCMDAICRSANDGYLADFTPPDIRGRAQGLFNAAAQLGSLIGALGAGFLYELGRSVPFVVIGGFQILLMLSALVLALRVKRRLAPEPVGP